MTFQRDKASFQIVKRLIQSLCKAMAEKRRGQSEQANMAKARGNHGFS